MKKDIAANAMEVQMVIKDCYEQLYKLESTEKRDKLLGTHNLPKSNE
jgi:hypothetical protein